MRSVSFILYNFHPCFITFAAPSLIFFWSSMSRTKLCTSASDLENSIFCARMATMKAVLATPWMPVKVAMMRPQ